MSVEHEERAAKRKRAEHWKLAAQKLLGTLPPCEEAPFWQLITQIHWPNRRMFPVGVPLMARFEFVNRYHERFAFLKRALEAWESDGSRIEAGDKLDFLCSHVIGLGRDVYEATVRDPKLAADRILANDFAEGFQSVVNGATYASDRDLSKAILDAKRTETFTASSPMAEGAAVSHPTFGVGFVVGIEPDARTLLFGNGDQRRLIVPNGAARPYKFTDKFEVDQVISHPKFGEGAVVALMTNVGGGGRIRVRFADGERELACG